MTHSLDHSVAARSDYRILRRLGAVVPFESNKLSTAMTKALMAVSGGKSITQASAGSSQGDSSGADGGSVASVGIDGASPGNSGDDGDSDGDGDGDGPRRKSRPRRKSLRTSAARRRPLSSKTTPDRAHSHALLVFAFVVTLALLIVLACALNGQPNIAEKVLLAIGSITGLAAAFVRPK